MKDALDRPGLSVGLSIHDGLVRSVTLKTGASLLERPIDKIVLLESVETSEGHLQ